ncbi:MAG: hypothetical protein R3F25_12550 [Gammaproteobacteria bacterium]|jgi:hypothetical protein|nr:hypothetical protein [Xanthomonadales bacterium]
MKKLLVSMLFVSALAFAGDYFANPGDDAAKLVLKSNKSTQRISSVILQEVNGDLVSPRENAVWLKPGEYQLRLAPVILNNTAPGTQKSLKRKTDNVNNMLNITVESGKTYYLGFDSSDEEVKNWKPVVWKEE